MALYRIAQEGLTNVVKHAGASRAELTVACSNGHASLRVRDNGKGPPSPSTTRHSAGWGLKNMRERAGLLGGSFSMTAAPGKGTMISVAIPVAKHNGSRNHKHT